MIIGDCCEPESLLDGVEYCHVRAPSNRQQLRNHRPSIAPQQRKTATGHATAAACPFPGAMGDVYRARQQARRPFEVVEGLCEVKELRQRFQG